MICLDGPVCQGLRKWKPKCFVQSVCVCVCVCAFGFLILLMCSCVAAKCLVPIFIVIHMLYGMVDGGGGWMGERRV